MTCLSLSSPLRTVLRRGAYYGADDGKPAVEPLFVGPVLFGFVDMIVGFFGRDCPQHMLFNNLTDVLATCQGSCLNFYLFQIDVNEMKILGSGSTLHKKESQNWQWMSICDLHLRLMSLNRVVQASEWPYSFLLQCFACRKAKIF